MPDFDMNTVLAGFLKDLQAGTLGPTWPITTITIGGDVSLSRGAADVLLLASGDKLAFTGVTANDVLLKKNGTLQMAVRAGDDSGYGDLIARSYSPSANYALANMVMSVTAPTVTSAGTSPSITASNGTAAFVVNVGTGGTATTIVLAMPAATTGWMAFVENVTATAANRANQRVVVQSSTTTSLTLQNQTISTGAALAFTASDLVRVIAIAY